MDENVVGVVAKGGVFDAGGDKRKLPPKGWRKHRWIAIMTHVVSQEQIEAMYSGEGRDKVLFDGSNLWDVSAGCIDCEMPYTEVHGKPCEGEEYEP